MTKKILGILVLGLIIAFGCSREPADASAPVANSEPVDLTGAIARAKTENKLVLMDFTGSDWCPPCMALHREIFSKREFGKYAESNLVFLVVDFPKKFHLPPNAGATNDLLLGKFNVEGFPTLVALDGQGKEVWRHLGFMDGGPQQLAATLDGLKTKAK